MLARPSEDTGNNILSTARVLERGAYEYFIGFTLEENVIALCARIWKNYGLLGAEE